MSIGIAIPTTPKRIILDPLLSDQEFEDLCAANSDLNLERTKEGAIVVNAPAGSGTGDANSEINAQLRLWWKHHRRGRVYDSSTGIFLPDGSSKSADSAYITAEQASTLRAEDLKHFLRFVPAFVIELRSETDSLAASKRKMEEWVVNGTQLGWLVDPYSRSVSVFEPNKELRVVTGNTVAGTGPVEGFVLDLVEVWNSYEI